MNTELTTKEQILKAVKDGLITQRPKWQFALHTAMMTTGMLVTFLLAIYLMSLISFVLHQSGAWFEPSFSGKGWLVLLRSLPWILIILTIIFIAIVEILFRHFSFAYQQPLIYTAFGIIAIVLFAGYLTSITSLHKNILSFFENNKLPVADQIYQHYNHRPSERVYIGTITLINDDDYIIESQHDQELHIIISDLGREHPVNLDLGDTIVVFGTLNHGIITADSIRIIGKQQAPTWFVPAVRHPLLPLYERFIPSQL